jgi:hypothetical protein
MVHQDDEDEIVNGCRQPTKMISYKLAIDMGLSYTSL